MTAVATAKKKSTSAHKFRDNIDAFAIAIAMAILFKFFAIEAYQIPTSSMQPTMMGSSEAGVYDRILVDKTRYELTEPRRWDIAVFRYPIRTRQNYVKRIVGTPGDRLRVAGGNIYQVAAGSGGDDPATLTVERRPASVQAGHWKEIYPARLAVRSQTTALSTAISGLGGDWSEEDGTLIVRPRSDRTSAILRYPGPTETGLVNFVWDGYPTWISRIMSENSQDMTAQTVQDARIRFTIAPRSSLESLGVGLTIAPASGPRYEFLLRVEGGQGQLVVEQDNKPAAQSDPFPVSFAGGTTNDVEFIHLDDRCSVAIDGETLADLDCSAFKTLEPIFPRAGDAGSGAFVRIDFKSSDEVRVENLRIDRDLHYVPSMTAQREVIEVPEGHYFMMGDNTLQSVDSRDWTAMVVGRLPDGTLVDPATHPEAEKLVGNMRVISLGERPDPDENPIVVPEDHAIVFTDQTGEVHVLNGDVSLDPAGGKVWEPANPWFLGDDGPWLPERYKIRFVPRDDILGRPLLTFWPLWSPFRLGLIR